MNDPLTVHHGLATEQRTHRVIPRETFPAGRVCRCGQVLSIYNPGPGCRRHNADALRGEPGISWAVRA